MPGGLRRLAMWAKAREKIDDEVYDQVEQIIDALENGVPEPIMAAAVEGQSYECKCPCCDQVAFLVGQEDGTLSPLPKGWGEVDVNDGGFVADRALCPECLVLCKAWMKRQGIEAVPLNRLKTAGSTLEAALLRLADDLEGEGQFGTADRIRSELVLGSLGGSG